MQPYPPMPAPQRPRPASATVFGILNILFSVLGLCGAVVTASSCVVGPQAVAQNQQILIEPPGPGLRAFQLATTVVGVVFVVVQFAAGIALLNLRDWGRRATLLCGIYGIIAQIVGLVVAVAFVWIPMFERLGNFGEGPQRAVTIVALVFGIGASLLGFIFPICQIYFMSRPRLRAELTGEYSPMASYGSPYTPQNYIPPAQSSNPFQPPGNRG